MTASTSNIANTYTEKRMHKTAGNILVFLGTGGIITNAVEYLARTPVTIPVFPVSVVLLVVGALLIQRSRNTESA